MTAKARAGSLDASIIAIDLPRAGSCFRSAGVRLLQCFPASRVRWICPVVVAAEICFADLGENASALMAGPGPRPIVDLPVTSGAGSSGPPAVRSGLTASQFMPLSWLAIRYCVARYSVFGSSGEKPIGGAEPFSRYFGVRSKMCCVCPVVLLIRRSAPYQPVA